MSVITLLSLVLTARFVVFDFENHVILRVLSPHGFIAQTLGIVCLFVILASLLFVFRHIDDIDERKLFILTIGFSAVVGIVWVLCQPAARNTLDDSKWILQYAQDAAAGRWESFNRVPLIPYMPGVKPSAYQYFSWVPYQSSLFWYFYAFVKAFGLYAVPAMQLVNVAADVVTVWMVYRITGGISQSKAVRCLALLLLAYLLPLHFFGRFLYGNDVGLALALVFCALQVAAFQEDEVGKAYRRIALSLLPYSAMVVIKSTFVLMGIAAFIGWVLYGIYRKRFLGPLIALCVVIAGSFAGKVPTYALQRATGENFGDGVPKAGWITVGLTTSYTMGNEPGWWDPEYTRIFAEMGGDAQEQTAENKLRIEKRLCKFASDPVGAVQFFGMKTIIEWCEPTYMSLYYSAIDDLVGGGRAFNSFATPGWNLFARGVTYFLDGLQGLMYIGMSYELWRLFRTRRDELPWGEVFLAIVLFVGMGCYLLWEAKSVYILPFVVLGLPLAARGLKRILVTFTKNSGGGVLLSGPDPYT